MTHGFFKSSNCDRCRYNYTASIELYKRMVHVFGWCPSTAVMDKAHFQFIVPPRANTLWYEGAKPWIGKPSTVLTVTVAGMGSPLRNGIGSKMRSEEQTAEL